MPAKTLPPKPTATELTIMREDQTTATVNAPEPDVLPMFPDTMPSGVLACFKDAVSALRRMFAEAGQQQDHGRRFYGRIVVEVPWEDGKPQQVLTTKSEKIRPLRGGS